MSVAEGLAAGKNAAKIGLVLAALIAAARWQAITARSKLILLSMIGTFAIVAGNSISPFAETAYQARIEQLTARAADSTQQVSLRAESLSKQAIADIERAFAPKLATHEERKEEIDVLLAAERRRVDRNGNHIGPNYTRLMADMDAALAAEKETVNAMRAEITQATNTLMAQRDLRIAELRAEADAAIQAVSLDDFLGATTSQHPYILRLAEMIKVMGGDHWDIKPEQVVVAITLIFGLCLELTPMVLFHAAFSAMLKVAGFKTGLKPEKQPQPVVHDEPDYPERQNDTAVPPARILHAAE